jgi:hypothetical protein
MSGCTKPVPVATTLRKADRELTVALVAAKSDPAYSDDERLLVTIRAARDLVRTQVNHLRPPA